MSRLSWILIAGFFVLIVLLLSPSPVQAVTFTVTTLASSGPGSLREAFDFANATAGDDIINFSVSGTITMSSPMVTLDTASPTDVLTINGGGTITIDYNNSSGIFQVSSGTQLDLNGLTLREGGNPTVSIGGAVVVFPNAVLNVTNSTLTQNTALLNGGAIYSEGTVSIVNSTLTSNSAENGGAIFNRSGLSISGSQVNSNSAAQQGGALYNAGGGVVSITTSVFASNTATVTTSAGSGGAILNDLNATLTVSRSTFDSNAAHNLGGAIRNLENTTVTNSTFRANSAASGGGIASGNFFDTTIVLTVNSSTFSANSATTFGSAVSQVDGTMTINNSILANSPSSIPECEQFVATVNAQNSIFEGGAGCVTGTNIGNLTGDPNLGTYVGSPAYFPLNPGSIAINSGNNALIPIGVTTDQPGSTRIQGGTVDRGAFESSSSSAIIVTVSPTSASVPEGSSSGFVFTRTGPFTGALDVSITISSVTPDMTLSDYTLSGGSISGQTGSQTVTFPAGAPTFTLNFAATDDVPAEPDNGLSIVVVDDVGYDLLAPITLTITIPANDLVVTVNGDSGEGSLRQAMTNANNFATNDTITFTTTGTISITSGELPLIVSNGTLTINGGGVITVTRSSVSLFRLFRTTGSAVATFSNLTISNGNAGSSDGGGIRNLGTLTLNSVTLSGNRASGGGAVSNQGSLTVSDSTIRNNIGVFAGSGNGGGILNSGTLTVTNSSFTANSATSGGGIYTFGSSATVSITGSRIIDNFLSTGTTGGGFHANNTAAGSSTISSTCIVDNVDIAVTANTTGTVSALGNWWGSSWGPNIPAAPPTSGSFVSTGDSIAGTGQSGSFVNVGIVTIPTHYGTFEIAPIGNWLTTAPAGCAVCSEVSSVGRARNCEN